MTEPHDPSPQRPRRAAVEEPDASWSRPVDEAPGAPLSAAERARRRAAARPRGRHRDGERTSHDPSGQTSWPAASQRESGTARSIERDGRSTGSGATSAGRAPRRGRLAAAVLVPLLALTGAGGWWWQTHRTAPTSVPSPSPASTPSATGAAGTPIPSAIEGPGPGTVESVRKHLLGMGFTCEREDQPGMASWTCTHYSQAPTLMAYVGGADGHRLGRVSLNVQDGPGGKDPKALALQQYLAQQFIGDAGQVRQVLGEVRAGNEEKYASTALGPVVTRGSGDGSIVLFVNGWVPDRAVPARLLPATPLDAALAERGYACVGSDVISCTRTAGGRSYEVGYIPEDLEVSYLKVRVVGPKGEQARAEGAKEVDAVVGLFQQRDEIRRWVRAHQKDTGATGYQDGFSLDWYPLMAEGGKNFTALYLRQSCWTDTVEAC
ncbi:hypothetical protein [Luteococcus peritonei]|uniref:Uncharacterized protein n=1 Tax=Luteococcus peritonei TaxID=88874 RepID=A0ABW4RSV5_9ACTN